MAAEKVADYHRRAEMALKSFPAKVQDQVQADVESLLRGDMPLPGYKVRRLGPGSHRYIMRVHPNLRVIFERRPEGILVEDIVQRDTLKTFIEKASPNIPGKSKKRRVLFPRKRLVDVKRQELG